MEPLALVPCTVRRFLQLRTALPLAACCLLETAAGAQCDPQWSQGFGRLNVQGETTALATIGTGPSAYLGSQLNSWSASVQRLDGATLTTIGGVATGGFDSPPFVATLAMVDLGGGPELVMGGTCRNVGGVVANNIARWNGSSWSAFGAGLGDAYDGIVNAVLPFDDGSGTKLYAVGRFVLPTSGGGSIARWNGTSWEGVGGANPAGGGCLALCAFDDGSGPALYMGGDFSELGGAPMQGIARWNGSAWSAVGGSIDTPSGAVLGLAVHDDGTGAALYACGRFTQIGGVPAVGVARWNGSAWSALGPGLGNGWGSYAQHLVSADDGSGAALFATGPFVTSGSSPVRFVARWDGASWSALGTGTDGYVSSARAWNDGSGPALLVGGSFITAGGVASHALARWRSGAWSRLDDGEGFDGYVFALHEHDDGSGARVFAGGAFTAGGSTPLSCIARWDGAGWNALAGGVSGTSSAASGAQVNALATFDDGGGAKLYAGGDFSHAGGVPASGIARWNGTSWAALPGAGSSPRIIRALHVFDDGTGPKLYVGGTFAQIGGLTTHSIARFDGTTWTSVGAGMDVYGPYDGVYAFASWDDGGGLGLFAGGSFTEAAGVEGTANLAAWRGGAWQALGGPYFGGANNTVRGLDVLDDGNGARLWLCGDFWELGGYYARGIGTWDGTRFWPVGAGFQGGNVHAIARFDAGIGHAPEIYATGLLSNSAGVAYQGIASWNGSAWNQVAGGGPGNYGGWSLLAHDGGAGSQLWLGGQFGAVGGILSTGIARLDPACADPRAFCFGDGTGTPCPCGNSGGAGRGCATSFEPLGARLDATGMPSVSADTIVLTGVGLSNSVVTFFQGTERQNGGAGSVFGDGLRCASGTTIRLGAVLAAANMAQFPGAGDASVSVRGAVPASGAIRTYQVWYRNAVPFCTSATFNLTNGMELTWLP